MQVTEYFSRRSSSVFVVGLHLGKVGWPGQKEGRERSLKAPFGCVCRVIVTA